MTRWDAKVIVGVTMASLPYHLSLPENRDTAVVFASPHSGRDYPWDFIRDSQLDEITIRSSEDAFVDRLYDMAPELGAPLLCATMPRAYVDLNRSAEELDPALIYGARQMGHNPRISSGLGVIPRVVGNGREIRLGKIGMFEARQRLDAFYHPYHDKLHDLISQARDAFGFALLLDCHSMPRDALKTTSYAFDKKPDIVLGDRFGAACTPVLMDGVEAAFTKAGLQVSRNLPFAGAFVVQNYGRPNLGRHVIQIEIDRSLYMDEANLVPSADFKAFKDVLHGVVAELTEIGRQEIKLAAE
jgi:N-formylglutamate amidohydrolase